MKVHTVFVLFATLAFSSFSSAQAPEDTPVGRIIQETGFSIAEVTANDNVLSIDVGFGAGCAAHDFYMTWNGQFGGSGVPHVILQLIHDGHGETCEAYETRVVRFDMTDILEQFASLYPPEAPLDVVVNGHQVRVLSGD